MSEKNTEGLSSLQIILLVLAGFLVLGAFAAIFVHGTPAEDAAATSRIEPVAKLELVAVAANAGNRTGEEIVASSCAACHGSGAMGAPKAHDASAWAPRLSKGLPALVKSAIAGKGAMPPKGGLSDITDEEIARAITFMAK